MDFLIRAFTFVFIFSCFYLIKTIFEFFRAVFSTPPKPIEYSENKKLYIGLIISFILTYLIYI
jgi:hypothetical protein